MLWKNERPLTDAECQELIGDGDSVIANGERRLLSRIKPPVDNDTTGFATPFAKSGIEKIPRHEWDARLKEQVELCTRVSDFQNFPSHDQDGIPTCWGNGPAHAATTQRVIQGLNYVEMSANSVCVPISGGRRGGYEGSALAYAAKHGFASVKYWANNDLNKSLMNDPQVQADRKRHVPLEWIDCGNDFDAYMTIALLTIAGAVAYNDWSHVISTADGVLIEKGSYGLRPRNNWGDRWGSKNKYGFGGYVLFREGQRTHGCPDSGFGLRQMTSSSM